MLSTAVQPGTKKINHLIFWCIFILYEVGVSFTFRGGLAHVFDYAAHFALNIGLFYLFYLVLVFTMKQAQHIRYPLLALLISLIMPGYLSVKYLIQLLLEASGVIMANPFKDLYTYIVESAWRSIYFMMLSTGYWFAVSVVRQKTQIAELENKNLRTELDKQLFENAFLQSQINPHFLFNTLNFLYTAVNRFSEKLGGSIVQLADLMRYSLKGPDADGKTSLQDEIEHVQNFIALNQSRFENQLHLDFQVRGDASGLRVIPLALITFVENVFKYADLKNPAEPAMICLNIQDEELHLIINNTIRTMRSGQSHGIGMDNVKKRLDIYHRDQYKLNVDMKENYYQLNLMISL